MIFYFFVGGWVMVVMAVDLFGVFDRRFFEVTFDFFSEGREMVF